MNILERLSSHEIQIRSKKNIEKIIDLYRRYIKQWFFQYWEGFSLEVDLEEN